MSLDENRHFEPSDPEERAELDLPPKSYDTAAKESSDRSTKHVDGGAEEKYTLNPNGYANGHASANGSLRSTESTSQKSSKRSLNDTKLVYGRYTVGVGESLTSVEPEKDYQDSLRHNEDTRPRARSRNRQQEQEGPQLATGRKAGAGWERSA